MTTWTPFRGNLDPIPGQPGPHSSEYSRLNLYRPVLLLPLHRSPEPSLGLRPPGAGIEPWTMETA